MLVPFVQALVSVSTIKKRSCLQNRWLHSRRIAATVAQLQTVAKDAPLEQTCESRKLTTYVIDEEGMVAIVMEAVEPLK